MLFFVFVSVVFFLKFYYVSEIDKNLPLSFFCAFVKILCEHQLDWFFFQILRLLFIHRNDKKILIQLWWMKVLRKKREKEMNWHFLLNKNKQVCSHRKLHRVVQWIAKTNEKINRAFKTKPTRIKITFQIVKIETAQSSYACNEKVE